VVPKTIKLPGTNNEVSADARGAQEAKTHGAIIIKKGRNIEGKWGSEPGN
jgi:hypothetical protein